MEHFYQNIDGYFDFEQLYSEMVQSAAPDASFVEVGAYYGKSAAYLATEIYNSGKNIKFHVVDTWRGSPEHQEDGWGRQEAMINDTAFDIFVNNLKPVEGYYIPHKMTSLQASALFEDNSLDFVFIDADHAYESVKADINAWYPKVKPGGYIGGHDYNKAAEDDPVVKAVDEIFAKNRLKIYSPVSWIVQK